MRDRLDQIDGLRGLAIAMVALFHTFSRWSDRMPYGGRFALWFRDGWLGVPLFFVISGFVILMTLERCHSFPQFIARRWLRLFPAMLICSGLIFVTAPLLPARPAGPPAWMDLLPGLAFITPRLLHMAGLHASMLEGAFWSMFVEIHFYVIFGALYFLLGGLRAILGLAIIQSMAVLACAFHLPGLEGLALLLGLDWFVWFACGALFYQWMSQRRRLWLAAALGMGLWAGLGIARDAHNRFDPSRAALALGLVALFWAALAVPRARALLRCRPLLLLGTISYPFYLLHENALVAMVLQMGRAMPGLPAPWLPLAPLALIGLLAWAIARHGEPWLRARLRSVQLTTVYRNRSRIDTSVP